MIRQYEVSKAMNEATTQYVKHPIKKETLLKAFGLLTPPYNNA